MKRVFFYLLGLILISLGSSGIILSELGAGAWDAVVVGLADTIGLTPGNWIMIMGLILMLINAFLTKEKIDFYAFITTFSIGILIDMWLFTILSNVVATHIGQQILLFFGGFLIVVIGAGIYLQANFAPSPVDNFMLSIHKRFKLSISRSRLIGESIALILALMFSGPISVGTFIFAFGIGPCIQVSVKHMSKVYQRLA